MYYRDRSTGSYWKYLLSLNFLIFTPFILGVMIFNFINGINNENKELAKDNYDFSAKVIKNMDGKESTTFFGNDTYAKYVVVDPKKDHKVSVKSDEIIAKYATGDDVKIHYSNVSKSYSVK